MFTRREMIASAGAGIALSACATAKAPEPTLNILGTIGAPESFDPRFDALIAPDTPVQIIAESFDWSEGPAWDKRRSRLLFSDVPQNQIHQWSASSGLSVFLEPAGAAHGKPYADPKPGTNGLWYVERDDTLLMCNQSGRSIDRLDLATGRREVVIDNDNGVPLNRPNDIVAASDGILYFTSPPFGLNNQTPAAQRFLDYNGVYSVSAGTLKLITKELTAPNGIALSPDERILYVAQSGDEAPLIMRYFLDGEGGATGSDMLIDLKAHSFDGFFGKGDGMAIDTSGNIFLGAVDAGLFVISPEGELLGRVFTGRKMSNCVFGEDGTVLFITADDLILRLQTKTLGLTFS